MPGPIKDLRNSRTEMSGMEIPAQEFAKAELFSIQGGTLTVNEQLADLIHSKLAAAAKLAASADADVVSLASRLVHRTS